MNQSVHLLLIIKEGRGKLSKRNIADALDLLAQRQRPVLPINRFRRTHRDAKLHPRTMRLLARLLAGKKIRQLRRGPHLVYALAASGQRSLRSNVSSNRVSRVKLAITEVVGLILDRTGGILPRMTDLHAVTDRFIELGVQAGRPLTQIEIQKFLYFTEGLHLALTDAPLFDEDFQAWALGPALPSVYRRLRKFADNGIGISVVDTPATMVKPAVMTIVQAVFDLLSKFDPHELVGLTHLPGSPWQATRKNLRLPKGHPSQEIIDPDLIAGWFKDVWDAGLASDQTEAIPLSAAELADLVTV